MNVAFRALRALNPDDGDVAPGTFVRLATSFLEPVAGRVAFVDSGWIYWAGDDGHVHASRADVITITRSAG